MAGSASVELMETLFPKADLGAAGDWLECAKDVYSGKIDAAVLPDSAYLSILHDMPALSYKTEERSLDIDDPLAIAVRPGLPDLLRWINDYLDVTTDKRKADLAELVRRYMGGQVGEPAEKPSVVESAKPESPRAAHGWWVPVIINVIGLTLAWFLVIRRSRNWSWLLSPWLVIGGMILGGVTGIIRPSLAELVAPPAEIYMNFWRLCVLPIMIGAIVTSVYRLLADGDNSRLVKRLVLFIPATLIFLATIGILAGIWGEPGTNFPPEAQKLLIKDMSVDMNSMKKQGVYGQFLQMANNIVPDNPLKPIVENKSLAVLFLSLVFGIMLAKSNTNGREKLAVALDIILEAFSRMIKASLYLLPLALYALSLEFTAKMGLDLLGAILRLSICMTVVLFITMVFSLIVLMVRLRVPIKVVLQDFGPMSLVAFSARSSIIAMPLGLEALKKHPEIDQDQAMAAFPLSLMICHSGLAVFFSLIPIFIGQVFQVNFTLG